MPRPITVLHPVHSLAIGGLERQLATVVAGLSSSEFCHVIAVRTSLEGAARVDIPTNVNVIEVVGDDAHFSRALVQIIDRENIDLVHIRGLTMLVDTVVAARVMRNLPVIASFHGFEAQTVVGSGVRRKLIREALYRCQAPWAVSRAAANEACRQLNLPANFFDVVPNGVDTDYFRPAKNRNMARQTLGVDTDAFVFLSVGNLKLIKGHDYLIRAFAQLPKSAAGQTPELILLGADYLDGELHRLTQKLNIADRVKFVGHVSDVRPWYHAADVFVLPSLAEGHCNALLEAMASGLPCIATYTGGNIDSIESGANGVLVESGNTSNLVVAMTSLMQDEAERSALSESARESVLTRFSHANMLERYRTGYQSVLSDIHQAEANGATIAKREYATA